MRRLTAAAAVAWACHASDFVLDDPATSVVTVVDSGPSLRSARTFVLPDTVVALPVASAVTGHGADHEITTAIRGHLVALGWRDAGHDSTGVPDVVVLAATATQAQSGVMYPDWFAAWGFLPYWGATVDRSWTWTTPDGAIPYTYEPGTLVVAMLDLRAEDAPTKRLHLLWAAALDGMIASPDTAAQRTIHGIDQAFAQSAYLRVP
jgi:hypothetical protein